jgi:redox-sensitive bicupin YhaK (pirin superfamily)
MSAGTGIQHSEKNDAWHLGGRPHDDPVHLIQMWVVPNEGGVTPGYEQLEISDELLSGDLITVASGMADHHETTAIRIRAVTRHCMPPAHFPEGRCACPMRRTCMCS